MASVRMVVDGITRRNDESTVTDAQRGQKYTKRDNLAQLDRWACSCDTGAMADGIGALFKDALFGQSADEVVLPALDPLLKKRQERAARLEEQATETGKTPAQLAIEAGGERAAEGLGATVRGRVLGTRGPGQALAARSAGAQEAAGRASIAGDVARGVAELGAAERDRAEQRLGESIEAQQAAELLARQERERRKRPGLLPLATTAIGALAGGALGGSAGAQLGAGLGQGAGSLFRR